MTIHHQDDLVTLHHGDCLDVLSTLADCSVDSVVTDPPYELAFMGKKWDGSGIAFNSAVWSECLRVLKPGGHLLSFGGSRTWHRLAVAIEDSGFELRDSVAWLYGSGFPKSLDVSKALDGDAGAAKQWQGWGTALKPAFEPIVVARRPFKSTVAANVRAYGTGALNVDACRVGTDGGARRGPGDVSVRGRPNDVLGAGLDLGNAAPRIAGLGRWPTNVVLDGGMADQLDHEGPHTKDGMHVGRNRDGATNTNEIYGARNNDTRDVGYSGAGGPSRFFPVFRYQAKAPTKERPKVDGVVHPTVKPLELMRWLVKLVTPSGGVVLDPFAGSGTTAEACIAEGFHCVTIEREADYLPLIMARIDRAA